LGFLTIQPSEFFKYAFVIFLAATLIAFKKELRSFKNFIIFILIFFLPLIIFYFLIHDFGTLASILFASFFLMLLSGLRYRYIFIPILIFFFLVMPALYYFVPYVHDRLEVFLSPESVDVLAEGYQLNQSLMTIGSGQLTGRGFGGSLQKFRGYIPEPLGDSIFAVFAEEFGFIGSVLLIYLFYFYYFLFLELLKKLKSHMDVLWWWLLGF
jgi:cell division protein FtsW (lipid II flippase)